MSLNMQAPQFERASACTLEQLWAAIEGVLDAFTPEECRNYFDACGYDPA